MNEPKYPLVAGYLQDPLEWFCDKYNIDVLNERLSVIEHDGNAVILFIREYLIDNGFTNDVWNKKEVSSDIPIMDG